MAVAAAIAIATAVTTASHPVTWPPAKQCPRHGSVLSGGPVLFTCSAGTGHGVTAAQLPQAWG
jgi:hypothetical protein